MRPMLTAAIIGIIGLCLSGCHCGGLGTPVLATPLGDDTGFSLAGILDFEGDLLKPTEVGAPWLLNWKFTFPTGGYAVEEVDVIVLESFPEQVKVVFDVRTPAPWEFVTQAIVEVDGSEEIRVDDEATFDIRIVEACNHGLNL